MRASFASRPAEAEGGFQRFAPGADVIDGAVQRVDVMVGCQRQGGLRCDCRVAVGDSWIGDDGERCRASFVAQAQTQLILAGRDYGSARRFTLIERAGNLRRIVVAQIPNHAIHAGMRRDQIAGYDLIRPLRRLHFLVGFRAGEMPNQLAFGIDDIHCEFCRGIGGQHIVDDGAGRRIRAHRDGEYSPRSG